MPSWIRGMIALLAVVTLISSLGFVLARWNGDPELAMMFAPAMKYSFFTIAGVCIGAVAVGVYHSIKSVFAR